MTIFLIILGALCLVLGLIGCILPALPGVPLAYAGLWLLQATDKGAFSWQFMLIWGIVVVAVSVLDYIIPILGTKQYGGSKAGVWGSTIGLLLGFFVGPWGIVLGPFCGALVGELLTGKDTKTAFRAGWGTFIGLLTGTVLKLVCCGMMTYYFVAELF